MPNKIERAIWRTDLPQTEKFVLLAFASFADDDGSRVFPSQSRVARMCGCSDRTVRRVLKKFVDQGVLATVDGGGFGGRGVQRGREHRFDISVLAPSAKTSDVNVPSLDQNVGHNDVQGSEEKRRTSEAKTSDTGDQNIGHSRVLQPTNTNQDHTKEDHTNIGASRYAFSGKVIRLTQSDFDIWRRNYPALEEYGGLRAFLSKRDAWLAEQSEKVRKKWFVSTSSWLANQNRDVAIEAKTRVEALGDDDEQEPVI
jgi:hypothetical protein